MCAEALTQEEIDALLRSHSGGGEEEGPELAPEEREAVNQYLELFQAAFSEVWSMLSGQSFSASLDKIESLASKSLPEQCPESVAVVQTEHEKDVSGPIQVLLPSNLATSMAGAMTGTSEFGELEQSALGEGLGQTFGSLTTQLSGGMGLSTQVKPVQVSLHGNKDEEFGKAVAGLGDRVVCGFLQVEMGDQSGPLIMVFSNQVIDGLMKAAVKQEPAPQPQPQPQAPPQAQPTPASAAPQPAPAAAPQATVQQAQFQPLPHTPPPGKPGNLDLILDIGMDVRVELGRTGMKIRDVLELGPGSVIELDKLAGEPVDLLVNDKLFARGEVVVIDENFGVRVTDILNLESRIQALGDK